MRNPWNQKREQRRRPSLWGVAAMSTALGAMTASAQEQPQQATNAQDEEINIVVPAANQTDDGQLTILRSDDRNVRNHYSTELFEIPIPAAEAQPYLRELVETEGGNVQPLEYADPATGETRHYVQVVYATYQRDAVRRLIEALRLPGATSEEGGLRRHLRVRNRLASDVADIIRRSELSADGSVEADNTTNSLFIRDSLSDGARALAAAQFYDVPPRTLELQVEIIEVDDNNAAQLGLDWDAWKTSAAGFIQLSSASRQGIAGEFLSFDTLVNIDGTSLIEFVNYLINQGRATVVTRTNLRAVNGEAAVLESSRHIPNLRYVQRFSADPVRLIFNTDTTDADDHVTETVATGTYHGDTSLRVDLRDVGTDEEGITLQFVPTIGTESTTATVDAVVNSLANQNDLDEPFISTRRVHSVLNLSDGQTVLVGSFDKSTALTVNNGIPGLRSVPGLRYLFNEETREIRRSKLLVFVTPRIDDNGVYSTDELDYGQRVPGEEVQPYVTTPNPGPTQEQASERDADVASIDTAQRLAPPELQ